jgi:hypothetical protein
MKPETLLLLNHERAAATTTVSHVALPALRLHRA